MENKLPFANTLIALFQVSLSEAVKAPVSAQRHLPVSETSHNLVVFANWQR